MTRQAIQGLGSDLAYTGFVDAHGAWGIYRPKHAVGGAGGSTASASTFVLSTSSSRSPKVFRIFAMPDWLCDDGAGTDDYGCGGGRGGMQPVGSGRTAAVAPPPLSPRLLRELLDAFEYSMPPQHFD